jgi:hypothetical protein
VQVGAADVGRPEVIPARDGVDPLDQQVGLEGAIVLPIHTDEGPG